MESDLMGLRATDGAAADESPSTKETVEARGGRLRSRNRLASPAEELKDEDLSATGDAMVDGDSQPVRPRRTGKKTRRKELHDRHQQRDAIEWPASSKQDRSWERASNQPETIN